MKDRMKKLVDGQIEVEIREDGPDGEVPMEFGSPPPKAKVPKPGPSSSGQKKGPVPGPYSAKKTTMRWRDATKIANSNDKDAVYHAAYSKTDTDTRYVMKEMQKDPKLASEIKKWHQKYLKGKGNDINRHIIFCESLSFHGNMY